jgi:hypothetical protein
MSLSIIAQPEQFVLGGNPTELRLETNNLYSAAGAQHKFRLTFTGIPVPGKQLIFSWQDVYITLTTSDTPNDSGYEIRTPTALTALSVWANADLLPALQANFYLNRDFTITLLNNLGGTVTVELTALAKGTAFDISFTTDAPADVTGASYIAGANQAIRPNFQTHLELYISQLPVNDFVRIIATQTHAAAESRFRLDAILKADYFGSSLPDYGGLAIKNISAAIIKFYMAYAESFGSPIAVQKLTKTATYFALQGAWGKDYQAQHSFLARLNAVQTILAHASSYKVSASQPHYLNYLHWWPGITNFKVYCTIVYTDATQDEVTLYTQGSGVAKPTLWCIPAGYAAIAAVKDPAKEVYSYAVWVGASNDVTLQYSQKVQHLLDTRPQLHETNLLFKNGFGVFEVFRCTGTVIEQTSPQKQTAQRALSPDYGVTDAQTVTFGQQETRAWQINTGYKSKAEMQLFVALALSPSVYKIDGFFRPVTLQTNEVTLAASRSGRLNEATFTANADSPLTQGSHV